MTLHPAFDIAAGTGLLALFLGYWEACVDPVLRALGVVLGVVFLALGVLIRWRTLRSGSAKSEKDRLC